MIDFTWAEDLPPFDEDADCPKCASSTISVTFHSIHTEGFPCQTSFERVLDGHLCRVCGRCGYGWCEAAVDTKPARHPGLRAIKSGDGDD